MRIAFAGLQRVDGKANTQSMADGKLPTFLTTAGFATVTTHTRLRTAAGLLELTSAAR